MNLTQRAPSVPARLWWLTFVSCFALMISPVLTAFGEETGESPTDADIVVAVTPMEEIPAVQVEADGDVAASEPPAGEPAADASIDASGSVEAPEPAQADLPADEPAEADLATDDAANDGGEADVSGDDKASDTQEAEADAAPDAPVGDAVAADTAKDTDLQTTIPVDQASVELTEPTSIEDDEDGLQGPVSEPQDISSLVEAEPETSLQLMSVNEAGIEGEPATALESLEESGDVSTLASALFPVHDTPENVVAVLVGTGVTYSNVGYTGATEAIGTFTGGTGIIGFEDGIIMGSGDIADVVGPNDDSGTSTSNGVPGDDDLATLAEAPTYDAAVLTFDFVPAGNTIVFSYVFTSEEYTEYVNDGFNDVFAFYVNGENCALVDGGAVSIDTINDGSNANLFINNEDGHLDTEMDGLTVVLTCEATVSPGETNTMKLAIADSGDGILDSNVFIQAKSFVVPNPTPSETPVTPEPSPSPSPSTTPVSPEPSETPATPAATPTQVPITPTPTEHAGKPQKPHTHYTSYKQYVEECEDPVPAVALAITTSSGTGGMVSSLPNTGSGVQDGDADHVLVIAAAIGAALSLAGALRTAKGRAIT